MSEYWIYDSEYSDIVFDNKEDALDYDGAVHVILYSKFMDLESKLKCAVTALEDILDVDLPGRDIQTVAHKALKQIKGEGD